MQRFLLILLAVLLGTSSARAQVGTLDYSVKAVKVEENGQIASNLSTVLDSLVKGNVLQVVPHDVASPVVFTTFLDLIDERGMTTLINFAEGTYWKPNGENCGFQEEAVRSFLRVLFDQNIDPNLIDGLWTVNEGGENLGYGESYFITRECAQNAYDKAKSMFNDIFLLNVDIYVAVWVDETARLMTGNSWFDRGVADVLFLNQYTNSSWSNPIIVVPTYAEDNIRAFLAIDGDLKFVPSTAVHRYDSVFHVQDPVVAKSDLNYFSLFSENPELNIVGISIYGVEVIYCSDTPCWYLFAEEGRDVWKVLKEFFVGNTHTSVEEEDTIPLITLNQNYPNPFNAETVIEFTVESDSIPGFAVYNILGEQLDSRNLVKYYYGAGISGYEITLDMSGYSSGIYFYTVIIGNQRITKKMILIH